MAHYGATLADVLPWIPNVTIDSTSNPTDTQAASLITLADNDVFLALGSLRNIDPAVQADLHATILDQAKRLVGMRAAADAYDAHFPERATDPQGLGNQLRARYATLLANLADAAQRGSALSDADLVPFTGPLWTQPGLGWQEQQPLFATRLEPGQVFADGDLGSLGETCGSFL